MNSEELPVCQSEGEKAPLHSYIQHQIKKEAQPEENHNQMSMYSNEPASQLVEVKMEPEECEKNPTDYNNEHELMKINEDADDVRVKRPYKKREPYKNRGPYKKRSEKESQADVIECHICQAVFKLKSDLTRHIASVHEGKKPFNYSICGGTFPKKQRLINHISSVHEGKKPFKCPICDYKGSEKGNLTKHISSVHEGKKCKCPICNETFSRNQTLTKQISSVHKGNKI